jgi:hypothetical protein
MRSGRNGKRGRGARPTTGMWCLAGFGPNGLLRAKEVGRDVGAGKEKEAGQRKWVAGKGREGRWARKEK